VRGARRWLKPYQKFKVKSSNPYKQWQAPMRWNLHPSLPSSPAKNRIAQRNSCLNPFILHLNPHSLWRSPHESPTKKHLWRGSLSKAMSFKHLVRSDLRSLPPRRETTEQRDIDLNLRKKSEESHHPVLRLWALKRLCKWIILIGLWKGRFQSRRSRSMCTRGSLMCLSIQESLHGRLNS